MKSMVFGLILLAGTQAILTIPPSDNVPSDTGKYIAKRESIELSGTIVKGHDPTGDNFWVNGGKRKQYTLRYVSDLDESTLEVLNNLADTGSKVLVKGTLKTWKGGCTSFDEENPISIYRK